MREIFLINEVKIHPRATSQTSKLFLLPTSSFYLNLIFHTYLRASSPTFSNIKTRQRVDKIQRTCSSSPRSRKRRNNKNRRVRSITGVRESPYSALEDHVIFVSRLRRSSLSSTILIPSGSPCPFEERGKKKEIRAAESSAVG